MAVKYVVETKHITRVLKNMTEDLEKAANLNKHKDGREALEMAKNWVEGCLGTIVGFVEVVNDRD